MRVLVTGGCGALGRALQTAKQFEDVVYAGRAACDVRNTRSLQDAFDSVEPDVVVHAAALTDHQHPNAAEIIETNIDATLTVARFTRAWGARLVYVSTHYVYPGLGGYYSETDECRPIGAYAWSKYVGERVALEVGRGGKTLVVRGSWYTPEKLERWAFRALEDAWCSREPVNAAAAKLALLVRGGASGVYNIGGPRRSFVEICEAEGINPIPTTRAELNANGIAPYPFPIDSSVLTAKFDAWVRDAALSWAGAV